MMPLLFRCIQFKMKSAATALNTVLASAHKRPSSEPPGATRQQAIAKTSTYQNPSAIVVFVVLVFNVYATRGLEPISYRGALLYHSCTCHCIRFYTIC
jgi:hypothetical protein